MPAKPTPAERLARIAKAAPVVTKLARAASLSVRVEPELLRRLRLATAPRSGAWIEADLYFSALVGQRTPDWVVLATEFAAELRDDLTRRMGSGTDERQQIGAIRRVIEEAHAAAPLEIRLEEDVIWLAVERREGGLRTKLAIDERLREMVPRFRHSREQSLSAARWFAGAARRLPAIARETDGFVLLAFASSVTLGGRAVDPRLRATRETFEELPRYLPESVNRWPLSVGLTTRGVHFSFTPLTGHQEIEAPATDPVLLEVRAGDSAPQLAHLRQGESVFLQLERGDVEIRTLARDVFRLRAVKVSGSIGPLDTKVGTPPSTPQGATRPQEELRAEELFQRGFAAADKSEKLDFYSRAIRLKPDYALAFLNRGNVLSELGDVDGALEDYNEVIRLKPHDAFALYNRGMAFSDRGDADRALMDYDEAIRLKSDDADAFNNRGIARSGTGDTVGALKDFDEAIRLRPNDADAYYNRGIARHREGDLKGALVDYDRAILLRPDDPDAFVNRANARSASGDGEGAERDRAEASRLESGPHT
ncbi:MAG: tetratricopeptide repeat protein [Acidobacteriia bacterium]|nr:tetratricopeptide repeat protein [Terriglobia bacterium]